MAAFENAAEEEVTASSLDLDQEISQIIFNTAVSYWRFRAAKGFLAVAIGAEERGKEYVKNTGTLVDADQVPRNDLHEVVANLAQLVSLRVSAESAVVAARLQLASDTGLSAEEILKLTAVPSDDFPDSTRQDIPSDSEASVSYYLRQAIKRRADYLAATRRTHEQGTLLTGAKNRLLPQLDVGLNVGYAQAQAGVNVSRLFSAPFSQGLGPNVSGSVTFSFPFQNRAAIGGVMQASGAAKQAALNAESIARSISQSVAVAIEDVRAASIRVQQSTAAVGEYQASLTGARQKYDLGVGSIVEIFTIEDRLTTALNSQIQAQSDYAVAVAELRFATGTLFEVGQATGHVLASTLVTLPSPGDMQTLK